MLCTLIILSGFISIVSASMNPNARIAGQNTTCSDADQIGPWAYSVTGGETVELKMCFENPSNDVEKIKMNYSITGQNTDSTEDDSTDTPNGHSLSVPILVVEVGSGATQELTIYIEFYDETSTDYLSVEFWAEDNNSISTESIEITFDVTASEDAGSGSLPFIQSYLTISLLIVASIFSRKKIDI